ncbi:hypothetical protein CVT25_007642 [Psilocybe cyanescens]|uniref:Uncharacterized protein n=1 Tax=Psilocybe cyanescens TaxID=93625 RepID=A0A409X1C6_PSICY|nr:hypothetical protein CVT25_007642 [Psilocybe cyanescens]
MSRAKLGVESIKSTKAFTEVLRCAASMRKNTVGVNGRWIASYLPSIFAPRCNFSVGILDEMVDDGVGLTADAGKRYAGSSSSSGRLYLMYVTAFKIRFLAPANHSTYIVHLFAHECPNMDRFSWQMRKSKAKVFSVLLVG